MNEEYNIESRKARSLYWFKSDELNCIYSPQELVVILNNALNDAIERFIESVQDAEEADPIFAKSVEFLVTNL